MTALIHSVLLLLTTLDASSQAMRLLRIDRVFLASSYPRRARDTTQAALN